MYGRMAGDLGGRVDFDRLKKERVAKVREKMKKYDLDVILAFEETNTRYLSFGPIWVFYKYILFFQKEDYEPIVYQAGMVEKAYRSGGIPNIKSRYSISLPPGLRPSNIPAYDYQLSRFASQIQEGLAEYGLSNSTVGIDVANPLVIEALGKAGIKVSMDGATALAEARTQKTQDEIELTRTSCSIVEACFEKARQIIRPGITEQKVWAELVKTGYELGAEGMYGGLVCSGPHSWPNANVITDRIIRYGDIILIDVYNVSYFGYRTCYYRTFSCGPASQQAKDKWAEVRAQTWDSIEILKPGITTKEIVEKWPEAPEFEYENEDAAILCQWGHGVGLTLYEAPMISRAWALDYPEKIQEGMVMALETIGPIGDRCPDYPYGQSVRIEEMIAVTKDGYDVLTKYPNHEIIECW